MSRSYRQPYVTDRTSRCMCRENCAKAAKRRASKAVRRTKMAVKRAARSLSHVTAEDAPERHQVDDGLSSFGSSPGGYRRAFQSWDIVDYRFWSPRDPKWSRK